MVVLEEHVVQIQLVTEGGRYLIHVWWNVAHLLNHPWPNLSDVHVNHETVVAINFEQLILIQAVGLDELLDVHVLVRKNHIRCPKLVSGGIVVINLQVLVDLAIINLEEEVALGGHFFKGFTSKLSSLFGRDQALKLSQGNLLLNQLVDLCLDLSCFSVIMFFMHSQAAEDFLPFSCVV